MSSNWKLSAAELHHYLKDSPDAVPIGMDAGLFPEEDEGSNEIAGEQLQALLDMVAQPEQAVYLLQGIPEKPEFQEWFYIVGDNLVSLQKIDEGFSLSTVANAQAMLQSIGDRLHVLPVAADLHYQLVMEEGDYHALRDMADSWDEVPAKAMLQADGLAPVSAGELYDSVANPEKRGRVYFWAVAGQEVTEEHILVVAEGSAVSWLALPIQPGSTTLLVQSAHEGDVERVIQAFWRSITD